MTDDIWAGLHVVGESPSPPPLPVASSKEDGPERILARMEQDAGVKLAGSERESALNKIRNGDYDIAFPKSTAHTDLWQGLQVMPDEPKDTPVIPAKAEEPQSGGYWSDRMDEMGQQLHEVGQLGETAYGGLERTYANMKEQAPRLSKYIAKGGAAAQFGGAIADLVTGDEASKNNEYSKFIDGLFDPVINEAPELNVGLRQDAKSHMAAGEDLRKALEGRDWITREVGGGLIDAAQSPSSAVSLIGGPLGGIAVADQYGSSYSDARTAGLNKEDAEIYAWSQAAPESISFIPAGKVLEKIPGIGPLIKARAKSIEEGLVKKLANPHIAAAMQLAKTVAGETIEEPTTGAIQDLAGAALAGQEHSKALSDFSKTQAPLNKDGTIDWEQFGKNRYRDARAAAVMGGMGGSIEAVHAHGQARQAMEDRVEQVKQASNRNTLEAFMTAQNKNTKQDVESGMDVVDQAAALDKEQQKERDFTDNSTYSAEQKAAEEEAGQRTIERQRVADQLAKNPAVKVAPVGNVSPEEVQAEWQSQKDAEDARLQRVDVGQAAERIRSRQGLAQKAADAEEAAKVDSARKAESALKRQKTLHENKVTDEVIAQNPGKTPDELVPVVQEALAKNPFVPPAPKPAAEPVKAEPKATKPTAKKAPPVPVQEVPATATPVKSGTQSEIDQLSAQLGLAPKPAPETLAMKRSKTAEPKIDPESFAGKHVRALRALVKRNSQTVVDVQNLTLQGKLTFAPNAESIGRGKSDDAAEYDTESGKMYIYTDHLQNPDDVAGVLVRALHESGHDNQFSDREGRSSVLREMMSTEETSKAAKVIHEAAKSGNKLAQRAVEKANEAGELKDFELIPYFVGEVAQAREGSSLGRLGGVARDIRRSGKDFLRDKLGMNLDLSMNDLHTASMQLAGEAVRTKNKGKGEGGSLSMTGGQSAPGFKAATNKYKGVSDQQDRFEFSDNKAKLTDEGLAHLKTGKSAELGAVLDHPELYKNYPEAAYLKVGPNKSLAGTATLAVFDGQKGEIHLHPRNLDFPEEMKSNILHEVQHYIQEQEGFTAGSAPSYFKSNAAKGDLERAEETYNKMISSFELAHAIKTLPPHARELYEKHKKDNGWSTANGTRSATEVFLEDGWAGRSTDSSIRRYVDKYHNALSALVEARQAVKDSDQKAFDIYQRDEGEVEARNTQRRMNMTDEERAAKPPLSTYDIKPANVLDTTKYMGKPSLVPQALAMRNPEKVTGTKEFKKWFGDSKVVDENDSPKVVYHGTRSPGNFDVWTNNPLRDLGMHFGDVGQANANRFVDSSTEGFKNKDAEGFHIPPSRIIPVYLSIKNPLRLPDVFGAMGINSLQALEKTGVVPKEKIAELKTYLPNVNRTESSVSMTPGDRERYVEEYEKAIKAAGYDGIVYLNEGEPSYVEYGTDEDGNEDPYKITDIHHGDSYITFDPNQIKSAIGNNGSFDANNPSILKMANPKGAPELPFTRKIPSVVSAFLSSSAGAGKISREIIEHAIASPAGERMIAEGTVGEYRDGVHKIAKERGVSDTAINKEISAKLDAIDKRENDYDTNLAAFKEVASQYGKAGDALIKFRNQADDLTFQMIRERVAQGTPLTAAEQETYTTMRNNLGRYAHRQYATQMGKGGKKYAKEIYSDYEKYQKENGNVSQKVKDNYSDVANAVKLIVDDHLMIPSDEDLMEMPTNDVKRLFDVWGGKSNTDAYSLSQMRSELSMVRDAVNENGDVMKATAENIVKDIIGLVAPKSPLAKSFRGGKIDQSILKERAWISPEIRKLMGEITDPAMRLFSTVAKQTEFIARSRMLLELRDNVEGAHLQPPGPSGRPEVKGMEQLKGKEYGPLENYYVSKNLNNLLASHVQQLATFEQAVAMAITRPSALGTLAASKVVQTWGNVAGKAKMLQIVGKPINFLINFMGGPRSMLVNGNLNPIHLAKAMNTAGHIIAYSVDPSKSSAEARRVTTAGITDSAFVGEINSEVYHELNKLLKEMQGKSPSKTLEALNKWVILAPKETYAMMDVVYKIANFYQQADAILPEYYKAEGIDKTQAQIDREAADIVNTTNVTYKRAAPIVKNLERYGITQFGTFFYEVFRSEVNNVKQGFDELRRAKNSKTPKGKAIMAATGSRRISGQLTAWYLTGMASRMLAHMVFGDDDDKEQKLRALLPDYLQNQDFVSFGKDKDGKDVLFDWSRVDPVGPITDLMRTAINRDGDFSKLEKDILDLYVAPRLGTRVIEALAATAGSSKKMQDPLVQEKFPNQFESILNATHKMGLSDNATKAWSLVAETFLPGIASGWGASNARPVMTDGPSIVGALATYGGARMYNLDNQRALNTASFDLNDALKANRAEISQFFDNHPTATPERVLDELGDKRDNEKQAFDKLQNVYDGLKAVGHSPTEIAAILKKDHISASTISDLRKGVFHFRSLSNKSIEGFQRNELIGKTLEEKRQIKAKWKNARKLLNTAENEMEEEN